MQSANMCSKDLGISATKPITKASHPSHLFNALCRHFCRQVEIMSKQNVQVKSLVSLRGISIKGSQCARWHRNTSRKIHI